MMRKRYLALPIGLLLVACVPDAPERVVERRVSEAPATRGPGVLRRAMLDGHNAAREAVGVEPLAWDETLAAHARDYAQTLARNRRFEHSVQPIGPAREGENLWTGTRDAYRYEEMIGHWVDERRDYVNGIVPAISRTGDVHRVTHYSQIVWRATSRVGCAVASNQTDDYLVCRYSPVGNVVGQRAY